MNKDKDYFTVAQLAKELDVSISTIHKWIKNETIPHYRVGKLIRIKKSSVSDLLK